MTAIGAITGGTTPPTDYTAKPAGKEAAGSGSRVVPSDGAEEYAVSVTLSDVARQSVRSASPQDANPTQGTESLTLQKKQPGTNGISYAEIAEKIATAKRQVQGKVGLDGVSQVVDGFGNIDTAKLAQLQAQEATKTPASA